MTRELRFDDLQDLAAALTQIGVLNGLGVLALCLGLAWAAVRLTRGPRAAAPDSVLFGKRIVDGLLFPVIALAFAFIAKLLLESTVKVAVFKVAVPMLISLVVIRLTVRVLTTALPDVRWVRIIERSISWIAWAAVALWVTGVLPFLLDAMDDITIRVGSNHVTLRRIAEGSLSAALVMMLVLWLASVTEKKLLRGTGNSLSMRMMISNIVRAMLLLIGLLMALSAMGIDLTALSVLGGAIGVGLGFGLQRIAANYVSGFVVLAERSIRIGDMVKVDGFEGRISDIRTRYTVIRALNGRESLVPNEMLITQRVENSSLADQKVALTSLVQVAYGTDVRALQPQLVEAIGRVPRVLALPPPAVQFTDFAADGINLTIVFWISDPEGGQGNVRSEVNLVVMDKLSELGVEIPFPQRVMHSKVVE